MWEQALNAFQCLSGPDWHWWSLLGDHARDSVLGVCKQLLSRVHAVPGLLAMAVCEADRLTTIKGLHPENRVSPPSHQSCFVAAYSS